MLFKLFLIFIFTIAPLFGEYYISHGTHIPLYPLKTTRSDSKSNVRYFKDTHGKKYGITNQIILCTDYQKNLQKVAQKYHLTFLRQLSKTLYLYKTSNIAETLSICNQITNEKEIKFAHPNFLLQKIKRVIDPYFKYQWHLKNTEYAGADINIEQAWHYTKGKGVLAAIIDEGIDIDHIDLKENIAGFANYNDPDTNYPDSKTGNWHGTACAGLLAATENDTGIIGVAPQTKLIAVRYSDNDVAKDIQAFNDLMNQGVEIISNSWGSYTNLDAYNEIFKALATKGREGKGILIFFASGNNHQNMDEEGINDESESPYVISIGASTHRDDIASYSNYGSSIDFVAPGGVASGQLVTTDAMGQKGYTDWNYNFNFIGTSASTPIAAGVAALMLSANPDLTRDDVINILQKTAVKIGDFPYIDGRNDYAGYGRIDAGKAVKLARTYYLKTHSQPININNFAHIIFQSVQKFSN